MEHVFHVGIVEQRAVSYDFSRQVIDGVSAYLPVTNHDVIVTTGVDIFQANTLQSLTDHLQITLESLFYVVLRGDIGKHHVAHIGINAPASTLAAKEVDMV